MEFLLEIDFRAFSREANPPTTRRVPFRLFGEDLNKTETEFEILKYVTN